MSWSAVYNGLEYTTTGIKKLYEHVHFITSILYSEEIICYKIRTSCNEAEVVQRSIPFIAIQ